MKKTLCVFLFWLILISTVQSQNLNWNTSGYTTGSLSHNFGSIGSPASTVVMNITGNTGIINSSFSVLYAANWPGAGSCGGINCALRTLATFTTTAQSIVYTFNFSPAVSSLSFTVYDIDGNGSSIRDVLRVTAVNGVTGQNVTMTDVDGNTTVTGSGTTNPVATASNTSSTDSRVNVSIGAFVTSLSVTFATDVTGTAGTKSFSIGNMDWTGVLPVRWVSFSGKRQRNGTNELRWTTEDDINTDYFTIDKSKNGQNYSSIGQVAVAGQGRNTYTFTDLNPGSGNSIYRIKQTDKSGQYEFSGIVLIKEEKNEDPLITVFPNPASEYIIINTAANVQLGKVMVFDATGRLVLQTQNGKNRLETGSLKPGLYCIKTEDVTGVFYRAFFLKQ
jgi:hypothetical protein